MLFNRSALFLSPLVLANLFCRVYGQHAVGLTLDLNKDVVVIEDPGNLIQPTPRLNAAAGAFYQYTLKKGFNVSAGLSLKHFKESIGLQAGNFSSTGQMVAQISLTAGQNIFLLRNRIYISPLLGGTLNTMLLYNQDSYGSGKTGTKTDSLVFSYRMAYARQYYLTLHAGVQMGFYLNRSVSVFVLSRYAFGLYPVSRQYISYRRNQEPVQTAVQTLKGSYLTFLGLGLSYALNRRPEIKE